MGKSLPSAPRLQEIARIVTSDRIRPRPKYAKPVSKTRLSLTTETPKTKGVLRVELSEKQKLNFKMQENSSERRSRLPLAEVVLECSRRWFQDTLKEAKAGDTAMQVLVGQMYCSGYGIPKDAQKGRAWISKASRSRNSVWKVGDKRPGYNASDSDSEDVKADAKQQ